MAIITLIDLPGIANPAILVTSLSKLKQYFAKIGQTPPAMPANISAYMPFRILVTEEIDETGKQSRRMQFIKPDASVAYQTEWLP